MATTWSISISSTRCNCSNFKSFSLCSPIMLRNGIFNLLTPEAAPSASVDRVGEIQLFNMGKQIIVCHASLIFSRKPSGGFIWYCCFPSTRFAGSIYISFFVIFLNYWLQLIFRSFSSSILPAVFVRSDFLLLHFVKPF